MSDKTEGYIYILTNPSFPQYVKLGYADDVEKRLKELNRSECIPFAFRCYAKYKVNHRLTDLKLHEMIDKLNPNLRSIDYIDGKKRVREFYNISKEDAYNILESMAEIHGTSDNLILVEPTEEDNLKEEEAEADRIKRTITKLPRMDWMFEQGLIKQGDIVVILNHPECEAKVVDSSAVEYKGEILSFNAFGQKVTGWKAIQIYAWMRLKDCKNTLSELREQKMKELGMC